MVGEDSLSSLSIAVDGITIFQNPFQLFDRSQKQALLTTEGKIFFTHVEQIMNGISNTLEEINSLKNLSDGIVNIVKISVKEDETERLQKLLVEYKPDFAFIFSGKEKSALNYIELPAQELYIYCNRRHRFRRQNVLPLAELRNELLLLPKAAKEFFDGTEVFQNVVAEIFHVQTIKSFESQAVTRGRGVLVFDTFYICAKSRENFLRTKLSDKNLFVFDLHPRTKFFPDIAQIPAGSDVYVFNNLLPYTKLLAQECRAVGVDKVNFHSVAYDEMPPEKVYAALSRAYYIIGVDCLVGEQMLFSEAYRG